MSLYDGSDDYDPGAEPIELGSDEYENGYHDGYDTGFAEGIQAANANEYGAGFRSGRGVGCVFGLLFGAAVCAVVLVAAGRASGADPELDTARMQARLLSERLAPGARVYTDGDEVVRVARDTGKKIVRWQGIDPADYPEFVQAIGEAGIHYRPAHNYRQWVGVGVVNGSDTIHIQPHNLDAARAVKLKAIWHEGSGPNQLRAGVREEVSRAPSAVRYYYQEPPPPVCVTG